jgi:hypothetical protein
MIDLSKYNNQAPSATKTQNIDEKQKTIEKQESNIIRGGIIIY